MPPRHRGPAWAEGEVTAMPLTTPELEKGFKTYFEEMDNCDGT